MRVSLLSFPWFLLIKPIQRGLEITFRAFELQLVPFAGQKTRSSLGIRFCPSVLHSTIEASTRSHELRSLRFLVALLYVTASALIADDQLRNHVTIYRDEYGVPHIVGDTEEATFFGYGYAQAEDHLEDMMVQYRDAQGRRAEVQGIDALGDGYLHFIPYEYRWDGDYLQRLLRTKAAVVENRDKIQPDVYKILDAFARGVNTISGSIDVQIPAWIDSVTAEDIEALERSHYLRFYSIHDALLEDD